jgi:hypothetical protein
VDLSVMISDLKTHYENAKADAERFLGEQLPELADLAGKAANPNPLVASAEAAVHVSPEIFAGLAAVIDKLEADLAAAEAAAPPVPVEAAAGQEVIEPEPAPV